MTGCVQQRSQFEVRHPYSHMHFLVATEKHHVAEVEFELYSSTRRTISIVINSYKYDRSCKASSAECRHPSKLSRPNRQGRDQKMGNLRIQDHINFPGLHEWLLKNRLEDGVLTQSAGWFPTIRKIHYTESDNFLTCSATSYSRLYLVGDTLARLLPFMV